MFRLLTLIVALACATAASAADKPADTSEKPDMPLHLSPPARAVPFDAHLLLRIRAALAGLNAGPETPTGTSGEKAPEGQH